MLPSTPDHVQYANAGPLPDPGRRAARLLATNFHSTSAPALVLHWLEAAGQRLVPAKADLRAEEFGAAMSMMVIFEYPDRETVRFRLAGSYFRETHGRELTGTNFLDLMTPQDRAAARLRMVQMVERPCGLMVHNTGSYANGRSVIFKTFALPLTDEENRCRYTIHVSEFDGDRPLPSEGGVVSMGVESAEWIDIGAGTPEVPPPV